MAESTAVTSGYVDLDVYGRGDDSVFGPGAREENARSAKIHLREIRDEKAGIQVRDVIDYDLYGRGDPRVFGKDAHLVNQSEGRAHLKQTRTKNKQGLRFLMIPARAKVLVRNVVKRVKQSERKAPEPKAVGTPGIAQRPIQKGGSASESPSLAATPKRVSSLLPIEESKPYIEEGTVLQGIQSFSSEDDIKIDLEDKRVEGSDKNRNAAIAVIGGTAGAAAVGGAVLHLSSNDNNTHEDAVYGEADSIKEDSDASTTTEQDESLESSDAILSSSTSVAEESESAESESVEDSESAAAESESGEELTSLYNQDDAFAEETDVAVTERSHILGVTETTNEKNEMEIEDAKGLLSTELEHTQIAAKVAMFEDTPGETAASKVENLRNKEQPAVVVTASPVLEAPTLEAPPSEIGLSTKPSNRMLDLASPTTPTPLPGTFNIDQARQMQVMNDTDDGTSSSSQKTESAETESLNSSAQVSSSDGHESSSQESASSVAETASSAKEDVSSTRQLDSVHAGASSPHEGGLSSQESASLADEGESPAHEGASSADSSANESVSQGDSSAHVGGSPDDSSAHESVSSAERESAGKMSVSASVSSRQGSSSEGVVEDDRTATPSSSEQTVSAESSEVAVSSSEEAVSSSDDVMTDSDQEESDDEFVDVVDNVRDLRELA